MRKILGFTTFRLRPLTFLSLCPSDIPLYVIHHERFPVPYLHMMDHIVCVYDRPVVRNLLYGRSFRDKVVLNGCGFQESMNFPAHRKVQPMDSRRQEKSRDKDKKPAFVGSAVKAEIPCVRPILNPTAWKISGCGIISDSL